MKKILTLCIVHKEEKVLLGMKKRGFGAGRWNGFGGKVHEGETIEEGARRELNEEAGITANDLSKIGVLEFDFENDPVTLEVHIFKVGTYEGEPSESEEMLPKWFGVNEIPFDQMWSDDIFWMPYFLAGKLFKGRFLFDKPSTPEYSAKIIEEKLEEVADIV